MSDGNAVLFASTLAHYIQDAHQPLHVHNNYDGQLSGQTGLHAGSNPSCSSASSRA